MRDRMQELLLRKAEILATKTESYEQITSVNDYPPCFESAAAYRQWLILSASAPTPMRKDFPAEPNYCRDCTPEGQERFLAEGRCLFPMVRFQAARDVDGDEEIVGYTPKRFLPQTKHPSRAHSVEHVADGIYETRWIVASNNLSQSQLVDEQGARRFADRWGIDFTPAGET
jgi:hypothetical protein